MREKAMRALATRGHMGMVRKGPGHVPYITHPAAVVARLRKWGVTDDETLAIAWGHDLLEDTQVTEEEILAAGGAKVLDGVKALTHVKGEDKDAYLERLAATGTREQIMVKCADRLCNVEDFRKIGRDEYACEYLAKAKKLFDTAALLGLTID